MTVKVVTVYEANVARGIPSHLATIGLYDGDTGACRAFLDGTYITAIRTSAAAALACDLLARPDARVLAIVGAGVQGEHHLQTFPLVRDLEEIRIASARAEDAERSRRRTPALRERRRRGGGPRRRRGRARHACRPAGDRAGLDRPRHPRQRRSATARPTASCHGSLRRDARLFVETREAFAAAAGRLLRAAGPRPAAATELGEVLLGRRPGRTTEATRSPSTRRWATWPRTSRRPSSSTPPRGAKGAGRLVERRLLDQPGLVGEDDGLDPVAQVELGQQARHVRLDRRLARYQCVAISVFERPWRRVQHLPLARRSARRPAAGRAGCRPRGVRGDQRPGDLGASRASPRRRCVRRAAAAPVGRP